MMLSERWRLWNYSSNWNGHKKTQVQFGSPGVANGILFKNTSRQQGGDGVDRKILTDTGITAVDAAENSELTGLEAVSVCETARLRQYQEFSKTVMFDDHNRCLFLVGSFSAVRLHTWLTASVAEDRH
jgi:hypothetical protein